MNWPLFGFVFGIAATVVMGVLLTAALVLGFDAVAHVVVMALVGLAASLPISYIITKRVDAKWQRLEAAKTAPAGQI